MFIACLEFTIFFVNTSPILLLWFKDLLFPISQIITLPNRPMMLEVFHPAVDLPSIPFNLSVNAAVFKMDHQEGPTI